MALTENYTVFAESEIKLISQSQSDVVKTTPAPRTTTPFFITSTPGREIIRKSTFQINPGRKPDRARNRAKDYPVYRGVKFGSITRPWWSCIFGTSSGSKICFSWLCILICAFIIGSWLRAVECWYFSGFWKFLHEMLSLSRRQTGRWTSSVPFQGLVFLSSRQHWRLNWWFQFYRYL